MLKRLFEDKRAVLFASILAALSLVILAGALNNLSFRPTQPLFRAEEESLLAETTSVREIATAFLEIPLWKQIAFVVTIILVVVLIALLLSPEMRRKLLAVALRVGISAALLYYVLKTNPNLLKGLFPQFNFETNPTDTSTVDAAPPSFEPPQVAGTFSFFVTLGIILVVAVIAWRFYIWWKHQTELSSRPHSLDDIARAARISLRDLSQQRGEPHHAIIQCYENMSQAVDKRRGIYRNYAMTAAEFAYKLEGAGLPREPVNRLTRLFESARYSARASTQNDIDEAVACLTSILKYCGEKI